MNWVRELVGKAGTEGKNSSLVVFLRRKYKGMLPIAPSHLDLDRLAEGRGTHVLN